MKRAVACAIFVGIVAHASHARADEPARDRAIGAFQEGRKYIDAGNCDAAITKLEESLSYEPSVGAHLSLADCTEGTEPLRAWRHLKQAASLAFVNHDDRLATAEARAAALEKKLPTLHVALPPTVAEQPGFELRVDGELVDRFWYKGGVIATKPGKHVVEASAPLQRFAQSVVVEPEGTTQVSVRLERETCTTSEAPARASAPPPAAPVVVVREEPGSTRRTLGLTLGAVGVAGLATGVVFGLLTLDKKSTIDSACGGSAGACTAPPGSLDAERASAKTTATIATASFIVGGAALVSGALLYFTAPRSRSSTTGALRVVPRASWNEAGATLERAW